VMSESGNRAGAIQSPSTEYIGGEEQTSGSETSQYREEKKSTEILLVVASERGTGQTQRLRSLGVVGPAFRIRD
jgi:hypothetical protein